MAADLTQLVPEFRAKLEQLLDNCRVQNVELRPYAALRTPVDQAKLWRQSRTRGEIDDKVGELRNSGADFLADCIVAAGPQNGRPVTNAIPGLSWHQWGEAVDCFWVVAGKAEWSTSRLVNGRNGYRTYAARAELFDLTAGGNWPRFKDWPHVQLSSAASPLSVMTIQQIDEKMKQRFG